MTTAISRRPSRPGSRAGLTLLELLLVVFILSIVALSAVAITDRADEQLRYDDTAHRLQVLRMAIAGNPQADYDGRKLLSGYINDVGELPEGISELIDGIDPVTATPAVAYAAQPPVFDPTPDPSGFNNADDPVITLAEPRFLLAKGFRGPYVQTAPGTGLFRDGWGNVNPDPTTDAINHGWLFAFDPATGVLSLGSLGSDNLLNTVEPADVYQRDVVESLTAADWAHPVNTVAVNVQNNTGSEISGANLRVSLLSYVNGRWRRFTSSTRMENLPEGENAFAFDLPAPPGSPLVPLGQHLLVAVQDDDGTPHSADDALYEQTPGNRVARRISLFPRTTPQLKLAIP